MAGSDSMNPNKMENDLLSLFLIFIGFILHLIFCKFSTKKLSFKKKIDLYIFDRRY